MFRVPMSSSNATQALKTLASRGRILRRQLRARGPSFSTSSTDPSTLTETMGKNPYKTMFAGMTLGYFVAMYLERTTYKDTFVRDHRHKATTGAVTGLPTAK